MSGEDPTVDVGVIEDGAEDVDSDPDAGVPDFDLPDAVPEHARRRILTGEYSTVDKTSGAMEGSL